MSVADALKKNFIITLFESRKIIWAEDEKSILYQTHKHKPGSRWIMPDFLGVSIRHDTSSFYLISCAWLSIHKLCIGRGGGEFLTYYESDS